MLSVILSSPCQWRVFVAAGDKDQPYASPNKVADYTYITEEGGASPFTNLWSSMHQLSMV